MKAVKKAHCPLCNYGTDTTDGKAKLKCKHDGATLILSAQWYARGTHLGKRIMQPCGPEKKDAEAFIAAALLAKRAGTAIPGIEKDISWSEAVENCNRWWDKAKMKATTREHYRWQVQALSGYFYNMTLLTITKTSVEEFKDEYGATRSAASVAHAVKTLKRIYTLHVENLDLESEPRPKLIEKAFVISTVKLPEINNTKTSSCTATDMQAVLAAIQSSKGKSIDKQRLHLAIMLGFGMLMRPCNINGLEWAEIDMVQGVIRIPAEKMKGKQDFVQAVPAQILAELKSWRLACGLASRYVFPAPKGGPMKNMYKAVAGWIKKAGLNAEGVGRRDKVTPYILTRHTGATELYEESGENLEMVSKTATHADSRITRKRYVKSRVEFAKRTVIPIQEAMISRMVG